MANPQSDNQGDENGREGPYANLYRTFTRSVERDGSSRDADDDLHRLAVAKALDLPVQGEEPVNTFQQSRRGIDGWPLVAMVATVVAGLLGWQWTGNKTPAPVVAPPAAETAEVVEGAVQQEFIVSFWADDGEKIEVGVDRE